MIGYVQLTMVILLMRFLFKIPIQGSIVELYVVGLLFIAAVLGLGMLISTIAKTQMQAMQMSTFFLLPFVFLSGYVFPIDGMPTIFQYISRIIPARYFIEVLRGIILRGAGLADLWRPDRVADVLHDPDHRAGGRALQEDRVVAHGRRPAPSSPAAEGLAPTGAVTRLRVRAAYRTLVATPFSKTTVFPTLR